MENVAFLEFAILIIVLVATHGKETIIKEEIGEENEINNNATSSDSTSDEVFSNEGSEFENKTLVETRRILNGKEVKPGARPYMVYLNLTERSRKVQKTKGWLCGGVIVHEQYVITSAACVEDGDKFYVISGTVEYKRYTKNNHKDKLCITKNKRRVIWKCVPKYYNFSYIDDVKWSANDIAVVKVDRPFKLGEVEEGCQFAAEMVPYNNISRELEEPGTRGYILGWGSVKRFREQVYKTKKYRRRNQKKKNNNNKTFPYKALQEAQVALFDKETCVKQWPPKFTDIILEYMICTQDIDDDDMSKICSEKYANCTNVPTRRESSNQNPTEVIDLNQQNSTAKSRRKGGTGGFCEYDHGGPLVVSHRGRDHVVGVISACRVDTGKTLCHGPFLYTSIFVNRQFIACTVYKDYEEECRRVFRTGFGYQEWTVNWGDEE